MAEEIPKQTTPEQETTAPTGKKKKKNGKSFLETIAEIDAKDSSRKKPVKLRCRHSLQRQEKTRKRSL